MKVRVKAPHGNAYGTAWAKKPGDVYGLPDEHAAPLIAAGLIEPDGIKPKRASKARKASAPKPKVAKPLAAEVEAAGGAHQGSA